MQSEEEIMLNQTPKPKYLDTWVKYLKADLGYVCVCVCVQLLQLTTTQAPKTDLKAYRCPNSIIPSFLPY